MPELTIILVAALVVMVVLFFVAYFLYRDADAQAERLRKVLAEANSELGKLRWATSMAPNSKAATSRAARAAMLGIIERERS